MLERHAADLTRNRLRSYPAVAIVGPRQCGKTTLAKSFKKSVYFDLEQEADRLRLDFEWDEVVSGSKLLILDEAQEWPELFSRLRGAIDADRARTGRFLLLGSVSPSLMTQVSESLAGRLSIVELSPLALGELATGASRKRLWLCGGYPDGGVLRPSGYPQWQRDYLSLLAQRDLPNWGLPSKPRTTDRFMKMLAAVHGQSWNASQIGSSMGLSYQTINTYVDYLVGAFLIRRLPPFLPTVRKRLVRSPKMYWRDSGLLHALMNVGDMRALLASPWVGASWEGFVVEQLIAAASNSGELFEAHYFRTSDGHEIDLVLDFGDRIWAVEVKLTSAPSRADMQRLEKSASLFGATDCFLVSNTKQTAGTGGTVSLNLESLLERV